MQYVFDTARVKRYRFPTHINDLVMDRSQARHSEVFIVRIEPGKGPPLHKHDDTEQVFVMLEGEGLLTIKGEPERLPVRPGCVVRVPPGVWHTIEATGKSGVTYVAVDCFGPGHNADEPTWDAHVRAVCRLQGWRFEDVVKDSARGG